MIAKTLPENIINIFKHCGRDENFIEKYIYNSVLSYIEEQEQKLIHNMKYNEWVKIDINKIREKIINYINKFTIACLDRELSNEEKNELIKRVTDEKILEVLCRLYKYGIYDDEYSRFILIKDIDPDECSVNGLLNKKDIFVRSRFIEIARNLYYVKQRFPDRSVYESPALIDRVFAYTEPRLLPLGRIKPEELYSKTKILVKNLYKVYNEEWLGRNPSPNEYEILDEIMKKFFSKETFSFMFYKYQLKGLIELLNNLIKTIKDKYSFSTIIQAATGAGKTEIFTIAVILGALIRRLSYHFNEEDIETPIAMIIYPRRALASDQFKRLIKYMKNINKILKEFSLPTLSLSVNYTEVLRRSDYREVAGRKLGVYKLPYGIRVEVLEDKGERYLELKYFKCPNDYYPRFKIIDPNNIVVDFSKVYCGDEEIDFIKLTKEDVKAAPGDIHVTLFETLRLNLTSREWSKLFGTIKSDGPRIIVVDEIHTYVGLTGARYAYLIRRIMTRIKHQTCKDRDCNRGFLLVGVSATIPNPDGFVKKLFPVRNYVVISPSQSEAVPLGNEYFYIIVPTIKYMVNHLSVTIQSVMTIFYNMPAYKGNNGYSKKAFVFADNLDVVTRLKHDLSDAIGRRIHINGHDISAGLQDLRNPSHDLFQLTCLEYEVPSKCNQYRNIIEKLGRIYQFNSWLDGELWWPYALETGSRNPSLSKCENDSCTTVFNRVIEYTSVSKEPIEKGDIIATDSALEVGVDYSDVVLIYQHGMPITLSALIQRAGRAGRRIMDNPLTRVVVAAMLSPYIPTQSALLELFIRTESLRNILEYEKLYLPVENKVLKKHIIIEAIFDYIALKGFRLRSSSISDLECRVLRTIIKQEKSNILDYISDILSDNYDYIKKVLDSFITELDNSCRGR